MIGALIVAINHRNKRNTTDIQSGKFTQGKEMYVLDIESQVGQAHKFLVIDNTGEFRVMDSDRFLFVSFTPAPGYPVIKNPTVDTAAPLPTVEAVVNPDSTEEVVEPVSKVKK